jgi:hypothetical protein
MWAAFKGDTPGVKLLLSANADVNHTDSVSSRTLSLHESKFYDTLNNSHRDGDLFDASSQYVYEYLWSLCDFICAIMTKIHPNLCYLV